MAKALAPGRPARRRALFGALDADGWAWAFVKAFAWFLIIILALGYIPDRAYYFTVGRTLDLGILAWSPVNLCPAENRGLPCPPPTGSIVPWELSPSELALPAPRTDGAAIQIGTDLLYAGGSDGAAAAATTYRATISDGSFGQWSEGPALPEARSDAALATLSGIAYLLGGRNADGQPTDTVWSIGPDPDSGELGTWTPVEGVTLPEPRSGAAAVAVTDGIIVLGGFDADGAPTTTVWKSTLSDEGLLGPFQPQPDLRFPAADAGAAFEGGFVWLYGGTDANGPSGGLQRGSYGSETAGPGGEGAAEPTATPTTDQAEGITGWAILDPANLPAARTNAAAFAANGILYLAGGSDGTGPRGELYWAVPDALGDLPTGWHHLDVTDLPAGGLVGAAPVIIGGHAVVIGGESDSGVIASSVRANLGPELPFFQLGPFGVVVPGLQIPGEIGQQLGYLAAAGVGTGNFVILVIIGWMFNHRARVRAWWERLRSRGRRRAAA
ncbi:MAG TPA: hypothetical protein VK831_07715 [Candidatus Deferrimicrobiaceae bacterium]|nr:hypothetical protein [Candidatus Deferrimicrobiaceae bacterium]